MKNPTKQIIILFLICTLASLCFAYTVSAQSTVVKAEASASQPHVGDTLTVNIKISNVQNLFGIDLTLNWNTAVLRFVTTTSHLGVESHPDGVLHETSSYPIDVLDDTPSQSTGEYHLMATSQGSSTPSFSGSGTIVTVTFSVTSAGPTGLSLESELSDKAASGGNANLIDHTDTVDTVNGVIPEFPTTTTIAILITIATAAIALSTKLIKNRTLQIKKVASF